MSVEKQSSNNSATHVRRISITIILVLVALLSSTLLTKRFSSTEAYSHQIVRLDEKKETVARLSAASAAASSLITLIPGDACTPMANQLAQVSRDFAVVLGAILLQKYLLTTLGYALFGVIVPLCCVATIIATWLPEQDYLRSQILQWSLRLLAAGVVLWLSVPFGIAVAERVEITFDASIQEAIDAAEQSASNAEDEAPQGIAAAECQASNVWCWITGRASIFESATRRLTTIASDAETTLSNFVEGLAVMTVTNCVIPLLTPIVAIRVASFVLRVPRDE